MYMMHQGQEPPHHHHLPVMEDDDDDYNDHGHGQIGYESDEYDHMPQGHPYPPHNGMGHPNNEPPPLATPQQPLQPPKQLFSPNTSRPPCKRRSTPTSTPPQPTPMSMPPPQQPLQPPPHIGMPPPQQPLQPSQPMFHPHPSSPPPKPGRAPHPSGHDDDDNTKSSRSHLCAVITILLFLIGLTALILWLLYRPSKPHYTILGAAVYTLNTTSMPPGVAASFQFTVLTRNPSKRTSIYYDRLVVVVHYRNHPITPPAALPPLHQVKRSSIMMSPSIGGGTPVAVPPELVEGLAADEAYGVVGLSWVLVGRVRYKVGWFKSGHSRVYVRCDVIVGFKNSAGEVIKPNNGQLPLLGNPPCFVDI